MGIILWGCLKPDIAQEMHVEVCATLSYSITPLTEVVGAGKCLINLAIRLEDGRPRHACVEVPEGTFHNDRGQISGYLRAWHDVLAMFY